MALCVILWRPTPTSKKRMKFWAWVPTPFVGECDHAEDANVNNVEEEDYIL